MKSKTTLLTLSMLLFLSSCSFGGDLFKGKITDDKKSELTYSNEICKGMGFSFGSFKKEKDTNDINGILKRTIVSCSNEEGSEDSLMNIEISDMKYYDNSKRLCDSNGYSNVYKVERMMSSDNEVVGQKVYCFNGDPLKIDKTKLFTSEFSNQDLKK